MVQLNGLNDRKQCELYFRKTLDESAAISLEEVGFPKIAGIRR